jgi:hypothetical protein
VDVQARVVDAPEVWVDQFVGDECGVDLDCHGLPFIAS